MLNAALDVATPARRLTLAADRSAFRASAGRLQLPGRPAGLACGGCGTDATHARTAACVASRLVAAPAAPRVPPNPAESQPLQTDPRDAQRYVHRAADTQLDARRDITARPSSSVERRPSQVLST